MVELLELYLSSSGLFWMSYWTKSKLEVSLKYWLVDWTAANLCPKSRVKASWSTAMCPYSLTSDLMVAAQGSLTQYSLLY